MVDRFTGVKITAASRSDTHPAASLTAGGVALDDKMIEKLSRNGRLAQIQDLRFKREAETMSINHHEIIEDIEGQIRSE